MVTKTNDMKNVYQWPTKMKDGYQQSEKMKMVTNNKKNENDYS